MGILTRPSLNALLQMKPNTNSDSPTPNPSSASSPSVPISVYRELAAELQATRVMLDSLNAKNQQLAQQNQQMRQEVEQVVQLGLNLRHWVETSEPLEELLNRPSQPPQASYSSAQVPVAASVPSSLEAAAIASQLREPASANGFTEEPTLPHRQANRKSADFSGIWLTLTILFIVLTAFGAGFLVMKPFLSGNR